MVASAKVSLLTKIEKGTFWGSVRVPALVLAGRTELYTVIKTQN